MTRDSCLSQGTYMSMFLSADRHSVDTSSFSQESLSFESLRKCNGLTRSKLGKKFLANGLPSQRIGEEKFEDLCVAFEATRSEQKGTSVDLLFLLWYLNGKRQACSKPGGTSKREKHPRPESLRAPGAGRWLSGRAAETSAL